MTLTETQDQILISSLHEAFSPLFRKPRIKTAKDVFSEIKNMIPALEAALASGTSDVAQLSNLLEDLTTQFNIAATEGEYKTYIY